MEALLRAKLFEIGFEDYPAASRVHALQSFPEGYFVKREDELGFGISGVKFRKYRTLISYLVNQGYKEVVVIGGAFSNHILGISQLLLEKGIKPILFLKGARPLESKGNYLWLQMVVEKNTIRWIPKNEWHQVAELAESYRNSKSDVGIIPEGCELFPALIGALTLPLDIMRNERELGFAFEHLFIDVGTGYSAIAVLLVFALLGKKTICHLLLLAEDEAAFRERLTRLHAAFEEWLGCSAPFPTHFTCAVSSIAPSFGSTGRALFDFVVEIARAEGFLLDPIYSAKLFYHVKERAAEPLPGKVLVLHSGGALTLAGFQDQLQRSLS